MPASRPSRRARTAALLLSLGLGASLTACAEGEGAGGDERTLAIDYATYNPLSLVIKDQGWLEESLGDEVAVEWVESTGSNKANEALRAGAIDVGSTAGSAALLARANGSPIKTIDVYTQPEWVALVTGPDSDIDEVADLRGRTVAATKGTDAYFFLLQALDEAGVGLDEVTVENLQHADGASALAGGAVDAWAGLDPIMADQEQDGARLFYRNIDFATYGVVNATEDFLAADPETAQLVVDTYARARAWLAENPDEGVRILAEAAGVDEQVARTVLTERTNLDFDHVPGQAQLDVLERIAPILVESGDVRDRAQVDDALETLLEPDYAAEADPGRAEAAAR